MHKLILVEGIPGAGKTTTARRIKEELEQDGYGVTLYEEGDSHPADMAWNAYLTQEEFEEFIGQCLDMKEKLQDTSDEQILLDCIKKQARYELGNVILAYTKFQFPRPEYWSLIEAISKKEICDGRRSLQEFMDIHLQRWSKFAKDAEGKDDITIFECAFLQNHIFELMGVYNKTDDEILAYLKNLLKTVEQLNPKMIYLHPMSVEANIEHVAKERKAPADSVHNDWIVDMSNWVENSNYGKHHDLKGKEGVIRFCEEKMRIDLAVINQLDLPVEIVSRNV